MRYVVGFVSLILVAAACQGCTTREAAEQEIHCFNEAPQSALTLPSFVNTNCPVGPFSETAP
jgi:hypothetical protein